MELSLKKDVKLKDLIIDFIALFLFLLFVILLFIPFLSFEYESGVDGEEPIKSVMSYVQINSSGTNLVFNSIEFSINSLKLYLIFPILIYVLALICFLIAFIFKIFEFKKDYKLVNKILYCVCGVLVILNAIMLSLTPYISSITLDSSISTDSTLAFSIVLYSLTFLLLVFVFSLISQNEKYNLKEIAESAVLIALAVVLDQFLKIPMGANGGSINLSAVPLFIIAIRQGPYKGFIASSIVFGILTCLLDGYGIQTYPFDYLIAFAGYCTVGLLFNIFKRFYKDKKEKYSKYEFIYSFIAVLISIVPVMFIRYFGHMISAFILYAPITFVDNFIYQSSYVPVSVAVSIGATLILLKPILILNKHFPIRKEVELKENEEIIVND